MTGTDGPFGVIALATCATYPRGDEDADALTAALVGAGVTAEWQVWNEPGVVWSDYPAVVVRSTWDYTADRAAFLRWAAGCPGLYNSIELVRWNSDKQYLRDLADAGLPAVESRFAAPGEVADLPAGEIVVKPAVGAGSLGAGRFGPHDRTAAIEHVAALHAAGHCALIQPYLDAVDDAGETALLYFDGTFSHAVGKAALLPAGTVHPIAPSDGELYVVEAITPRTPSDAELSVSQDVLDYLGARFDDIPLYARIDLLPGPDGPVILELELIEPSLFLGYDDRAASTFATAMARRLVAEGAR